MDSGVPDAGIDDAGEEARDGGAPDAAIIDAGEQAMDGGPEDAGPEDGGEMDAGPLDAGFDAGPPPPPLTAWVPRFCGDAGWSDVVAFSSPYPIFDWQVAASASGLVGLWNNPMHVAPLDPDGHLIPNLGYLIPQGNSLPRLASNGTEFGVTWNNAHTLVRLKPDGTGVVADGGIFTTFYDDFPTITSSGDSWIVSSGSGASGTYITVAYADGGVDRWSGVHSPYTTSTALPGGGSAVAWDGTHFWISAQRPSDRALTVTLFDPDAGTLAEVDLGGYHAGTPRAPIALAGGTAAVFWEGAPNAGSTQVTYRFDLIADGGFTDIPLGVVHSSYSQKTTLIAQDGVYLALWSDDTGFAPQGVFAAVIDPSGSILCQQQLTTVTSVHPGVSIWNNDVRISFVVGGYDAHVLRLNP